MTVEERVRKVIEIENLLVEHKIEIMPALQSFQDEAVYRFLEHLKSIVSEDGTLDEEDVRVAESRIFGGTL